MKNKIIPILFRCSFLLLLHMTTLLYAQLNKYTGNTHILKTFIDDAIPFEKLFIIPYLSWPFFLMSTLVYFAIVDGKTYFRLLASCVAGKMICFVIYYFYPTTVPRPDVVGTDVFSYLVSMTYSKDNPFNCFPSIHVLCALLACMFLCRHSKRISVRAYAVIMCVLIILSTMFVKQHYSPDAISGVFLGVILYFTVTSKYISNLHMMGYVKAFLRPSWIKGNYINLE